MIWRSCCSVRLAAVDGVLLPGTDNIRCWLCPAGRGSSGGPRCSGERSASRPQALLEHVWMPGGGGFGALSKQQRVAVVGENASLVMPRWHGPRTRYAKLQLLACMLRTAVVCFAVHTAQPAHACFNAQRNART